MHQGDTVEISHIEANYDRGLSADILGAGTTNDYHRSVRIDDQTKVVVRKDKFQCGSVGIKFSRDVKAPVYAMGGSGAQHKLKHLIVEVNGTARAVKDDRCLKLM